MPKLTTQSSSKFRVTDDSLGNHAIVELSSAYESNMSFEEFRSMAVATVERGTGGQKTKNQIITAMYRAGTSRKDVLQKAINFIFGGMGLRV
jgi:hypothetical protein